MLHIASIDNLSGAAYRLCTPDFDHSLRFETPARICALLAGGHCDAALMPVACLPALRGRVVPLGAYGIACRGPVRSVQLFSKIPVETLLRDQRPIYTTPKSRTSVELLRVLCRQVYGIEPARTTAYPRAAAHLLIGDAAYEYACNHEASEHDIDLGEWWWAHTGHPFVFARWVAAPTLSGSAGRELATWLEACAARVHSPGGTAELATHDIDAIATAARQHYYDRLQFRLDDDALAGLDQFLQLMESTSYESSARIA